MKILVIHSWGLGDLIMATPMLKSLAKSRHEVDLVLFSKVNGVILKENNFLENIFYITSKKDFFKFFRKYDALVATAGTNPKKMKFLAKILGIKKVFASFQEKDIHRIDMNLKIVKPLLKEIDKKPYIYISNEDVSKYLKKGKNIGFAVGSGARQKFKRWGKFKELISKIEGNKLIFIGPDEKDLEKEFKEFNIVKEPLEKVITLISKLDLMVGNDNGLMHIAYATKINTVTIYGMTNEKETGGYRKNNKAVFLDLECRPCFDPATDKIGCNTLECLKNLESERVWKVCQQFL